jgi:hypothetical protein
MDLGLSTEIQSEYQFRILQEQSGVIRNYYQLSTRQGFQYIWNLC